MRIGVPLELSSKEERVAVTPDSVKKLSADSAIQFFIQSAAGRGAKIEDEDYRNAGAEIVGTAEDVYKNCDIVLKVACPLDSELSLLRENQVLIGMLQPYNHELKMAIAATGVTAFSMELMPRISRAQNMDVLSSQANLAGYKAVLIAATSYKRAMPMLITAAGTIKAARVVVMGVGVAGLQAIATAKRLGCVVEATDVRPETKEQVESLGAKFIEVPVSLEEKRSAEGDGGYAREMGKEYQKKQKELVGERIKQADIVITTALIPGKPAPELISENMVEQMKQGSVIVDMAAEQGGNCVLSEADKTVEKYGVSIMGFSNLASSLATDASALYSRNVCNFLEIIIDSDSGSLNLNLEDEIVRAALVCQNGRMQND